MTSGGGTWLARLDPRRVVWLSVLVAVVAFLPSLADGYVFDDDQLIVENAYVHDTSYLGRCFTTDLWDTPTRPVADSSTRFYRPLVCASYVVNWKLGGGSAFSFHLVNVLAHAVATALAASLAVRWTGMPIAGLVAAILFAAHPTRTENVVWIAGRTDVLMAIFLLGAEELAVRASRRVRSLPGFVAAFALFGVAVLSKEFAVAWPFLLVVEILLARAEDTDAGRLAARRLSAAAVAASLLAAAYLGVRAAVFPIRPAELDTMTLPPLLHAGYVLLSLGYYVERLVFPWPQTFHFRPVELVQGVPALHTPSVLLGAVAAVGFVVWLVSALRRDRPTGVMLAVSGVILLPVLNVSYTGFPGTTADRFLYLPLLPLAAAAARELAGPLARWAESSRLAPLVLSSVSLLYSAVGWVRSLDYASDEAIWEHELDVNPDNPQALAALGHERIRAGQTDEGIALIRRSLSPEALRYTLLANPTRAYLALVELEGPRLADGDVGGLTSLEGEIEALLALRVPDPRARKGLLDLPPPPPDEHFLVHVANAASHLASAGALVASRLPDDAATTRLADRASASLDLLAPAHYNLALALGRASEYAKAHAALARAVALDGSEPIVAAVNAFDRTLTAVESLRVTARSLPEPSASLARARAFVELGAYLRAARGLRPQVAAHADDASLLGAYFEALVNARLDDDASVVAAHLPGDPAARIAAAKAALSPRVRDAKAPPGGAAW